MRPHARSSWSSSSAPIRERFSHPPRTTTWQVVHAPLPPQSCVRRTWPARATSSSDPGRPQPARGATLFVCAYGCQRRGIPLEELDGVIYCGLVVLADVVTGVDRFVALN